MLRILLTDTFKEKCISNLGQEIDKDKSMILQKNNYFWKSFNTSKCIYSLLAMKKKVQIPLFPEEDKI